MSNNINLQILHMTKCKNLGLNKNNSLHDTFYENEVKEKILDILNGTQYVTTNCVLDMEGFMDILECIYKEKDHRIDIRLESKDIHSITELGLKAYNIDYVVDNLSNIKGANFDLNKVGLWKMDNYIKYPFHYTVTFNSGIKDRAFLVLKVTISNI